MIFPLSEPRGSVPFDTFTVMEWSAVLPPASRATALITCRPFETRSVVQEAVYGAAAALSKSKPSILKSTWATEPSSEAVALIVTSPERISPSP